MSMAVPTVRAELLTQNHSTHGLELGQHRQNSATPDLQLPANRTDMKFRYVLRATSRNNSSTPESTILMHG